MSDASARTEGKGARGVASMFETLRNAVEPGRPAPARAAAPAAVGRWDSPARVGLAVILLVLTILLLRRLHDSSIHYPDADRIRMDGVFILDFLRTRVFILDFLTTLPLRRMYEFTVGYYAQYPAIDLGYRPPFFPMVEAAFNAVFGINVWSSRLALLPFAFAGTAAWFALVRRVFDTATAFWTCLLFATTPFVVQWGWYTMSDLPMLFMVMLLAYLFYRSTESPAPVYLYATGIALALAVWTKQTAIFLVIWFALYLVLRRQLLGYLRNVHVWVAALLSLIVVTPIALMTLWLGDFNLAQSVGNGDQASLFVRLRWDNLIHYPWLLLTARVPAVTAPVLALSAAGFVLALRKRDWRLIYFVLLIATTYAFFTYLIAKGPRYAMSWIPAFALFAALPLAYLKAFPIWRRAYMLLLAAIAIFQVTQVYAIAPYYTTGYDRAAQYIVDHRASSMVFFDGDYNGNFIYFVRAFDPDRSIFVLRADKLFMSSGDELKVQAHMRRGIAEILDKYGVTDIVVLSREESSIVIHHELRRFLDSGPFRLVHTIPVESNFPDANAGNTLKIYRYLEAKPRTADRLELRLPLVGATINAPLPRPAR
jgi:Dolichyl-phosphate-mannose-protein mannosyltransferase